MAKTKAGVCGSYEFSQLIETRPHNNFDLLPTSSFDILSGLNDTHV